MVIVMEPYEALANRVISFTVEIIGGHEKYCTDIQIHRQNRKEKSVLRQDDIYTIFVFVTNRNIGIF